MTGSDSWEERAPSACHGWLTAREGLKLTRSELRRKQQLVEELVELARGSLEQSRKDVQVLQRLRERRLGPHLAPS